ncbi:MAG: MarR family winged helix-turn-helix transcriptional regulator [Bacillota bacterium]
MKLENEIQQKEFTNQYQKAIINIIFTNNWLMQRQSALFKPYDITAQQYNILRILRGQHPKPATIKLLKERMLDKMSDVSRLVEKLRLKGLVDRFICPVNRRNVDVSITDKGLEILSRMDKHRSEMEDLLTGLDIEEIKTLNDLLDKLRR